MESITLDTAAGQKCVESASIFKFLGSLFSKLAYGTANFAVVSADRQNVRSGNIKISIKHQQLSKLF